MKGGNQYAAHWPLMIEHRLIEKMIKVMKRPAGPHSDRKKPVSSPLIETITDFIRAYADPLSPRQRGRPSFQGARQENNLFRAQEDYRAAVRGPHEGEEAHQNPGRSQPKIQTRGSESSFLSSPIASHALGDLLPKTYRNRGQAFFSAHHGLFHQGRTRTPCSQKE